MIKVTVTQQHIENGQEGVCTNCPIALALKEQGYEHVWVDDDWIGLEGRNSKVRYPLPRSADLFIDDYDHGQEVKPFSFALVKKILPLAVDLSPDRFSAY